MGHYRLPPGQIEGVSLVWTQSDLRWRHLDTVGVEKDAVLGRSDHACCWTSSMALTPYASTDSVGHQRDRHKSCVPNAILYNFSNLTKYRNYQETCRQRPGPSQVHACRIGFRLLRTQATLNDDLLPRMEDKIDLYLALHRMCW